MRLKDTKKQKQMIRLNATNNKTKGKEKKKRSENKREITFNVFLDSNFIFFLLHVCVHIF